MSTILQRLLALEIIAPIDAHFARTMARLVGGAKAETLVGAALASARTREGHVCADLVRVAGTPIPGSFGRATGDLRWPELDEWTAALTGSELVGDGLTPCPLVLDRAHGRLYLRRYWEYEQRLARQIKARAALSADTLNLPRLHEGVERLFSRTGPGSDEAGGQRRAAVMAVLRRFAIISGGPGTGKTSTVVKLLALLVEQAHAAGQKRPVLTLVAPTGKAAARLVESIQRAKASLPCDAAVKQDIAEEATTIHRCLRPLPGRPGRFRHDAEDPLATDLVLVDEASMVDLALMVRLLDAVPPTARLILLGDRDQLASVDAGAVLGDLCNADDPRGFSAGFAGRVAEITGDQPAPSANSHPATGVWDCVAHLTRSYRYAESSGIGVLARAVNAGDVASVRRILSSGDYPDVTLRPFPEVGLGDELKGLLVNGYRPYLTASGAAAKFDVFNRFRVLCAHRHGPHGVDDTNEAAERALTAARLITRTSAIYAGRPVLVTTNDYNVRLFNGDIGLILEEEPARGRLVATFTTPDGKTRALSPSRLPPHVTAFAMTIHKSQGSEFDEVVVLLPPGISPILSRELIYTAVTRARSRVTIFGDADVVAHAVARRIERASGLREAIWK